MAFKLPTCPFCLQELKRNQPVMKEVTGWVEERKQGGANAIRLQKPTHRMAHTGCVDKAVRNTQDEVLPL